jgi:hypothetical protein
MHRLLCGTGNLVKIWCAFRQYEIQYAKWRMNNYTVCPTRYRTLHFFNNFTTNYSVATIRRTTDTSLFISHTTNAPLFKFRCNIFIGAGIIKEMPGSVASGTPCTYIIILQFHLFTRICQYGDRDSVVGMATATGWTSLGSNPSVSNIFRDHPDRLCDPSSLLHKG